MEGEFVKKLIEAGVHFGHRVSRWNPKMAPYIYGRKNSIHILDIRETLRGLLRAKKYLNQVAAGGSLVLFVGTKRQASETVQAPGRALRHAVRLRALVGWSIDQLPHHSQSARPFGRVGKDHALGRDQHLLEEDAIGTQSRVSQDLSQLEWPAQHESLARVLGAGRPDQGTQCSQRSSQRWGLPRWP